MKISLFYKTLKTSACFMLIFMAIFMFSSINKVYANSQTTPLLEPSMPLSASALNSLKSNSMVIVEDQALQPIDNAGLDYDINPYISTSTEKISTYTVQKGDTLGKIAKKFGISESTIIFANNDVKTSNLKVGQTLVILPIDGITYKVQKGDTLSLIATKYKASVDDIADFNNIDKKKGLKVGDSIIVPGGTVPKVAVTKPTPEKVEEKVVQVTPTQVAQNPVVTPVQKQPEVITPAPSTEDIEEGYIWPLPKGVGRISQKLHADRAVDIAAPKGSPIYAIASGTVLIADGVGYNGGYGQYVVINFNNGAQAIFGHMSKVLVKNGQEVKQGDIIGLVGSTGHSTGPHIHLGIRGGFPNPFEKLPMNAKDYQEND